MNICMISGLKHYTKYSNSETYLLNLLNKNVNLQDEVEGTSQDNCVLESN